MIAELEPMVGEKPETEAGVGTAGSWELAGNIKGPAGSVSGIPDPLVLGTMQANTALKVGNSFRIIPNSITGIGALLQTSSDGGTTWVTQASWP